MINLSPEPVHVLCSVASNGNNAIQIQDSAERELPIKVRVKQGPLDAGEHLSLGKFSEIAQGLNNLSPNNAGAEDESNAEQAIEVRVAAIHGLSDQPAGAAREFMFRPTSCHVVPTMAYTAQKRSRRAAREVREWMEQCGSYRKQDG